MAAPSSEGGVRPRRPGVVLVAALAGLVALAALAVLGARPEDSGRQVLGEVGAEDAPAVALLILDTVDPNRGTATLRLSLEPGGQPLPPEGVTLFTNVSGLGPLHLPHTELANEATAETFLESGNLADYPFDDYPLNVSMALVAGQHTVFDVDPGTARYLPLAVLAVSTVASFDASSDARLTDGVLSVDLHLTRPVPTVVWAVSMMVIYWLLAISAVAVVLAIWLGIRPFETRHLAWLTALLFAFAAFRNTAPGGPPIGVFLDFGAFFWAVGLVVLAELALLACYLGSEKGRP